MVTNIKKYKNGNKIWGFSCTKENFGISLHQNLKRYHFIAKY
jgi:hypothetical protein